MNLTEKRETVKVMQVIFNQKTSAYRMKRGKEEADLEEAARKSHLDANKALIRNAEKAAAKVVGAIAEYNAAIDALGEADVAFDRGYHGANVAKNKGVDEFFANPRSKARVDTGFGAVTTARVGEAEKAFNEAVLGVWTNGSVELQELVDLLDATLS